MFQEKATVFTKSQTWKEIVFRGTKRILAAAVWRSKGRAMRRGPSKAGAGQIDIGEKSLLRWTQDWSLDCESTGEPLKYYRRV